MCARRLRVELLAAAALLTAAQARAQQAIYGPDGAPTVVQNKLHTMSGRWEVGALFDVALNNALVDQFGGLLTVTYHPNEWLDFGVEGLLHKTSLSFLAQDVRAKARERTPSQNGCGAAPYQGCLDEFKDDNQLRAGGFGVVRMAPIYGKFNLASELKVHFQAFVLGGAGVAQIHRESVNLCADPGTSACQNYQQTDATRLVGDAGVGFRFYVGQRWSLTSEVRGYFFSSSYKQSNDLTAPATGAPKSYLAAIATFDAGLSFLF